MAQYIPKGIAAYSFWEAWRSLPFAERVVLDSWIPYNFLRENWMKSFLEGGDPGILDPLFRGIPEGYYE